MNYEQQVKWQFQKNNLEKRRKEMGKKPKKSEVRSRHLEKLNSIKAETKTHLLNMDKLLEDARAKSNFIDYSRKDGTDQSMFEWLKERLMDGRMFTPSGN